MVNSTWTFNHVNQLWSGNKNIKIVYPPVSAEFFYKSIPLNEDKREKFILSIAQFRREKNHLLQLEIFNKFLNDNKNKHWIKDAKLILIGGVRNSEDQERVNELKKKCKLYKIEEKVEFNINATYKTLCDYLGRSIVGLHTMKNEQLRLFFLLIVSFGICVVENQAAGVIPLSHLSAGPKMDIVVDYNGISTGFLATDLNDYVEKLNFVFESFFGDNEEKRRKIKEIQANAKESSKRFSEEVFISKIKSFI